MRAPERNDWYAQGGWTNPGPVMSAPRSFGMWDGLFLWALLSNLNRPGATDFFHNHQSDPGYQQWRTEAESRAREDETLRRRLDELDRQLGAKRGQAVDVNYLPPGVPANVALAKPASARTPSVAEDESGGGGTWIWVAVILVAGVAIFIVLRWRGMRAGGQKDKDMGNLGTVGSMLRNKLSGEVYRPDRFRVGMTFAFDPTPFVLASGVTKIIPPTPDTGSRRLTVTSIGTVAGQGFELLRLYLPDERSVFQLHLDASGNPDECRFFSTIDVISPADQSEWAAWLDPREGMIGWPQFQTKDGRMYDRAWTPGGTRVMPVMTTETVEAAGQPARQRRLQSMLYAAATAAVPPSPETEYVLVSAVEADGQAWVEIAAGIDVSPGILELS